MTPIEWEKVRRVLVVRLDNIGDVVLLSAALRELRRALPHAEITFLASPAGSQVAPLLPAVDDVMVKSVLWQDAAGRFEFDPQRELEFVNEIARREFDAAFIFTSFSQSPYPPAYIFYLAGVPLRFGQSKEFGGAVLSHRFVPPPDAGHQAERNLFLLESLGLPVENRNVELVVPTAARESANGHLRGLGLRAGEEYILLAPGATCSARRYAPELFAEVARQIAIKSDSPVVVVGPEKERVLIETIVAGGRAKQVLPLVGQTSVPELAALIESARLVIANDSGSMHIADAFARPAVILFSGTELESQWEPRRSKAILLRRPTLCAPCYNFTCPYNMECLDIAPAEVVGHALDLLRQTRQQNLFDRNVFNKAAATAT